MTNTQTCSAPSNCMSARALGSMGFAGNPSSRTTLTKQRPPYTDHRTSPASVGVRLPNASAAPGLAATDPVCHRRIPDHHRLLAEGRRPEDEGQPYETTLARRPTRLPTALLISQRGSLSS